MSAFSDFKQIRLQFMLRINLFIFLVLAMLVTPALPNASMLSAQTLPPTHNALAAPHSLGLVSFDAKQKKKQVVVNWTTGNEADIVGFKIWRRTGNLPAKQLNQTIIPALSLGELVGNSYTLRDKKVVPGRVYFYQLEVLSAQGYSAFTDEVRVRIR